MRRRRRSNVSSRIVSMDGSEVQQPVELRRNYITGQPTSYDRFYCQLIVDRMREEGISLTEFAAEIGVHSNTLLNWRKEHQEFNRACQVALGYAEAWWEKLGRDYVLEKKDSKNKLNTSLYILIMKNRFNWRDNKKVENNYSFNLDGENLNNVNNGGGEEISFEERTKEVLRILAKTGYFEHANRVTSDTKTK